MLAWFLFVVWSCLAGVITIYVEYRIPSQTLITNGRPSDHVTCSANKMDTY